ncbi:MAG: hypothetical protein NTY68_01750 [Candidatus Micrarchaeota archaeon]|nr:hypothetical protein [Candidatus Micrarchaeota archaeon]
MERANPCQSRRLIPIISLIIAMVFVICSFGPMLTPITNKFLVFASGDLITIAGSAAARADMSFYILKDGYVSLNDMRFFILGSTATIAHLIPLSDSQFLSGIMLLSIVMGSLGVYLLIDGFVDDKKIAAALIAMFIPFYFLNPWSTERLIHIWIWITYAVLPMQMALGLMYARNRNPAVLGVYSLLISAFGIIPHSLIYMMGIHAAITAYAAASKANVKNILIFALIPLVFYILVNAPFIFMLASSFGQNGVSYPGETDKMMLDILSTNGGISNIFTMWNIWHIWWPDNKEIRVNPAFTLNSFFVFIAILALFSISYKKMDKEQKILSIISMAAILVVIFIAQGMNNQILAYFVNAMSDNGLDAIIGPFREWARICLMIPVFLVILFSISINASKKSISSIFAVALCTVIIINTLFSPSWYTLSQRYAPVSVGDTYSRLESLVPSDSRVVWIDDPNGIPITALSGAEKASTARPYTDAIGSEYNSNEFKASFMNGTLDRKTMDSLGISYVILYEKAENPYSWLDCSTVGYYKLCHYGESKGRIWIESDNKISKIISYKRIDPTRWEAISSSPAPFTLSFAEKYNPGWEARIYKNGDLVSVISSVQNENGINDFRINDTGELDIKIVYAQQETFELMWIFSILGILACMAIALGGLRTWLM